MDARSLNPEQRDAIRRTLARHRDYLAKLVERMQSLAWVESDPMRVEAMKSLAGVGAMLDALAAAEPAAPFLAHYGSGGTSGPRVPTESASLPWVGKRKRKRRR
jgi:hypothetical protein